MDRQHKAFVVCSDQVWREFRALCTYRGRTVQDELARLVRNEVTKDRRDRAATLRRKDKAAKVIREATRGKA